MLYANLSFRADGPIRCHPYVQEGDRPPNFLRQFNSLAMLSTTTKERVYKTPTRSLQRYTNPLLTPKSSHYPAAQPDLSNQQGASIFDNTGRLHGRSDYQLRASN